MRFLYDSTPAEFRSAYRIAESVERLSTATKRSVFSALGETTAVGKVSEKVVRLQRVIPMVGNSFKPFFIGHFEVRGEVTVLIGKFTMLRRPWAWWCGFLLLGLSVCWSLFAMSARVDVGPPLGIKVIFSILSCVVVGIWGRWWYAQRKHFLSS